MQNLRETLRRPLRLARVQLLLPQVALAERLRVRVESQKHLSIPQRVLLLHARSLRLRFSLRLTNHGLDFGRVDQTGDVGVRDDVRRDQEVFLQCRWRGRGTVDLIERGESRGSPDDEATEVATWRELEEVEGQDGAGLDTGDVAERAHKLPAVCVGVVDYQGSTALDVTTTA